MDNQKKFLLIFPPAWDFSHPYLALYTLASQLRTNNFNTKTIDLNIEFYNKILTKTTIEKSIELAETQYINLLKNEKSFLNKFDTYEKAILNCKYKALKDFFPKKDKIMEILRYTEDAVNVYKLREKFYNHKELLKAQQIIEMATFVVSLPFRPLLLKGEFYSNEFMPLDYYDIKNTILDTSINMYSYFLKKNIQEIINENYSYIGISIGSYFQLLAGLTIANELKQKTNAHINIGGNFFTRIIDNLKKYPDFFDTFADSVSYSEGENSIVELAKYINNEISITDVHNLVYKKNDEVIINELGKPVILSQICMPDFSDVDFKKYFSPEAIIPIQTQRGCYWKKCTFCDMAYGKTYTVKKIDDLINELKHYVEIYKVRNFIFVDEAIQPEFLLKFSEAVLKNNLDIRFLFYLRMEKNITETILKRAYDAGLRCVQWGVETGNNRIHKLINKGVDFKGRDKLLKLANKVGILNIVFSMYNVPTETYKEALDTLKFLKKNNKFIQAAYIGEFGLARHSEISKRPNDFGIEVLKNQEDFRMYLHYKKINGMTEKEKKDLEQMTTDYITKNKKINLIYSLQHRQHAFLYVSKFGLKEIKKIKLK